MGHWGPDRTWVPPLPGSRPLAVFLRLPALVGIGRSSGKLISAASDSPRQFCSQQFPFPDPLYLLNVAGDGPLAGGRRRGPSLSLLQMEKGSGELWGH